MSRVTIRKSGLFSETLEELLRAMSSAGFFKDGLLVGSWVFVLYGSIYGVEYPIRTFDVDFAVPPVIDPTKSGFDLEKIITGRGYLPVTERSGWRKYTREGFGVEFLTNRRGSRDGVDVIKPLNITALRLPFLDLLFESPITVDIPNIRLRIPSPESLFLHKLITSQRRIETTKSEKDLDQCHYLVKVIEFPKVTELIRKRHWSRESRKRLMAACEKIGLPFEKVWGVDKVTGNRLATSKLREL
jgi:hypothetical protein